MKLPAGLSDTKIFKEQTAINILLRITYDGTNYSGFQIQDNASTVQEALEHALGIVYKQPVRIIGAGRTDAGVHARGQAASFKAPFHIAENKIPHALNALLPEDIVITGAAEVDDHFHARYDARRKLYSYTIDRAAFPQVMKRLYSWHLTDRLNLDCMREAAKLFEGLHDFKAFQAEGSEMVETRRTLYKLDITACSREQLLLLSFEGDGFLYRMARLITGTLVRVAMERLSLRQVSEALQGSDTAAVGPTAPARGLCLEKVIYDQDCEQPDGK